MLTPLPSRNYSASPGQPTPVGTSPSTAWGVTPAPAEAPLIFVADCPSLAIHRTHLRGRGFRPTTVRSPECKVLILCADHLSLYDLAVAKIDSPKVVVGGLPPAHWKRAEGLSGPVLPAVLERHIVKLLSQPLPLAQTRYKILMVEDDVTVRTAATEAFEDAGFEVRSVGGFALVQEEMTRHPDFVLLDLNLPGLSGEALGGILQRQHVPIAVFSSESPARLEAARTRIGAVAAFSKGTPLHEIAAQVRKLIVAHKGK